MNKRAKGNRERGKTGVGGPGIRFQAIKRKEEKFKGSRIQVAKRKGKGQVSGIRCQVSGIGGGR